MKHPALHKHDAHMGLANAEAIVAVEDRHNRLWPFVAWAAEVGAAPEFSLAVYN